MAFLDLLLATKIWFSDEIKYIGCRTYVAYKVRQLVSSYSAIFPLYYCAQNYAHSRQRVFRKFGKLRVVRSVIKRYTFNGSMILIITFNLAHSSSCKTRKESFFFA